ncbi:uncharacterized protein LOC136088163 [Hydra vulgaris]|uniref:Uncharacterized protein LOC136088163 n=1 Tax=Hydra vulgaris TaxID=6087 RepID=A0ABM4D0Y9_HYDVU
MSFDGASNMQGINKGVVTHLKHCSPMAINIYCGSHGTNLVMKACAKSSVVSVNLFGTENKPGDVQKLKTFLYGNSRKRNNIFEKCKSLLEDVNQSLELAATHSVRFSALQNATDRLLTLYPAVIDCLEQISNDMEFKMNVRSEAQGLLSRFQSYETIVTLCLFKEIFTILGSLNKILQGETLDFSIAIMSVDVSLEKLQVLRDSSGKNVILSAVKIATEAQLEQLTFVEKRTRRKKRLGFDETDDERLTQAEDQWLAEVFYTVVDSATAVLDDKFSSQRKFLESIDIFLLKNMSEDISHNFHNSNSQEKIQSVLEKFKICISLNEFTTEMIDFVEIYRKAAEKDNKTLHSFLTIYNFMLRTMLDAVFPSVAVIYKIFSTIPTNSAECERVFSKLKLVKTLLANRLTSEHVGDRVLLSVEHEKMWNLTHSDLIKNYADTNELRNILYP